MMKWLYDFLMYLADVLLARWAKAGTKLQERQGGAQRAFQQVAAFRAEAPEAKLAWFHVASLGEYEQAKPLIAALKAERPALRIAVSFFSPSGYRPAAAKPQAHVDCLFYLPLDRPAHARKLLHTLRPQLFFCVKYDIWPNFLLAAKASGASCYLIAAVFRENQPYFRSWGGFFRGILPLFDHVFTQNEETSQLLQRYYPLLAVTWTGDTRYDRVLKTAAEPKRFPEIEDCIAGRAVLVAGSVWEQDMQLLLPFIREAKDFFILIAPHAFQEEQMERWLIETERPARRYSKGSGPCDVLLIDNVGMLAQLYQYATVAYVGGASGDGLHNILEPIGFRVPVVHARLKRGAKFPESAIAQEAGLVQEVRDPEACRQALGRYRDAELLAQAKNNAAAFLQRQQGSSQAIMDILKQEI
ncbi:MAG: 3-deoxy-D-manno-octulosonic acid transferase [Nitritalea sp.]